MCFIDSVEYRLIRYISIYRLSVCIDIGFKIVSSGVRTWVPVAGVLYTCRFERSSSQLPSTQVPSLYSTYVYKFLVMRPDGRYMYLIFTIFHKRKICGFKMRFCSFAVLFAVLKTAQNRTLKNCGFICGFKNRTKPHAKQFAVLFAVWKPHAEKFAVLNAVPITIGIRYFEISDISDIQILSGKNMLKNNQILSGKKNTR